MTIEVLPDTHLFGLACWSGPAQAMRRAHRHDDIEVNVVVSGRLDYLFGARRVSIPAGATSVFWAALPHQLVSTAPGSITRWLTVPLNIVLAWQLVEPMVRSLLSGAPLITAALGADPLDAKSRFARWTEDLAANDKGLEGVALLEMEAYLHRLLRVAEHTGDRARDEIQASAHTRSRAAVMATFVATRFRDPLSVDDVAEIVHLNPRYAMKVFRDGVGTTIGTFLNQCRLAEAQRLLITTHLTVASVAHEAGFGSSSRLYAACVDAGLPAPATYRRIQRAAAGWSVG